MIPWQTHFQPGETLLWEGAPLPGIRGRGRLAFLSLFGVPFLVFGLAAAGVGLQHIFWLGKVGIGITTLALGLIFLVFGYAFVFGQWADAARAHRTTRYAISTRCAYIARTGRKLRLETYPILAKSETTLERCKGYDNLWFHLRRERDSDGDLTTTQIGFEGIADGLAPYTLIRKIQAGLT